MHSWRAEMVSPGDSFDDLFPLFLDGVFYPKVSLDRFQFLHKKQVSRIRSLSDNWRKYSQVQFLNWLFPEFWIWFANFWF